ncbi:ABC transporter ATP-binding protein [Lichenicola cladoniae]|uniref:ABC transporter ATP-binding protein n=1 Tax=Lichenicola cladoniae TaxID=1484109 RepID=A0A6M8HJX0_9PROT|nr:ABC transporter ATP-binding protein [Lichenicola cladoniae]NPD65241.1 ABC transporter ATP-binding protein [Acetobacteraceae bacterium]QKE88836.1 ABC transporter ATP-binding protein [Lichenicola cladoniae]
MSEACARPTPDLPVLAVDRLSVTFASGRASVRVVDDVSFTLGQGEILALLGESGCGKSMTALAIMGLVPGAGRPGGRVMLDGEALLDVPPDRLRALRGQRMAMVFQDPMSALNPVLSLGNQIGEALRCHTGLRRAALRDRVVALLGEVGLADPAQVADRFPHELSGGMCQRVMIAMAIACDPGLLIADEPTTALDVTVQKQILDLLHGLRRRHRTAILLITHDLGVVAENADRVAVMYAGQVVEEAPVAVLYARPAHPYTLGLLRSMPRLESRPDDDPGSFYAIPGTVPDPANLPPGCRFEPRCDRADQACRETAPALEALRPDHRVRCWHPVAGP